jgi:aspartate/methionine/tyrosine aminotransferase
VGAAAPLQAAGITALAMPPSYYSELSAHYTQRRNLLLSALRSAGFHAWTPRGAYYIMTDISTFGAENDRAFAMQMVREFAVAAVPGSSFYRPGTGGSQQIRFTFCKKTETLDRAAANLRTMAQQLQTAATARS